MKDPCEWVGGNLSWRIRRRAGAEEGQQGSGLVGNLMSNGFSLAAYSFQSHGEFGEFAEKNKNLEGYIGLPNQGSLQK